jgi:hypothetical protein
VEHAAGAPGWAIALQDSAFAFALRDSSWIYPAANLVHILGLALLVGSILAMDLRLLGAARWIPIEHLSRLLTPMSIVGLCCSFASGVILFSADAAALAPNPIFQLKMCFLAFALGNAVLFRLLWQKRLVSWQDRMPVPARLQALASGLAWLLVGSSGRLIAYF